MAEFYRILAFLPIDSWRQFGHHASRNGGIMMTDIAVADPKEARDHFQRLLSFETDCWDVNEALNTGKPGFVLLDVRSPESYRAGHLPGAINLPHRRINQR